MPTEPVKHQVFEPFKAGLPNLSGYLRQIWMRKTFIHELSLAERRIEHMDTVFGHVWTILSPILMALIYFLLVVVLQGGNKGADFFIHLLSGVFIFAFIGTASRRCATSITGSGRLIMNSSFPRAILPLTQTWSAFLQLLPSLAILLLAVFFIGPGFGMQLLWAIPALLIILIFTIGFGLLIATANVYFRDTTAALPYITRLWTYASPVLYTTSQLKSMTTHDGWIYLNPMFAPLEIFSGTVSQLEVLPLSTWLIASGWSLLFFFLGAFVFLYREGEFAVRV